MPSKKNNRKRKARTSVASPSPSKRSRAGGDSMTSFDGSNLPAEDVPDQPVSPDNNSAAAHVALADIPIIDLVGVDDEDDLEAVMNASLSGTPSRPMDLSSPPSRRGGVSPSQPMSRVPRLDLTGGRGPVGVMRTPLRPRFDAAAPHGPGLGFGGIGCELPSIPVLGSGLSGGGTAAHGSDGSGGGRPSKADLVADKSPELNRTPASAPNKRGALAPASEHEEQQVLIAASLGAVLSLLGPLDARFIRDRRHYLDHMTPAMTTMIRSVLRELARRRARSVSPSQQDEDNDE